MALEQSAITNTSPSSPSTIILTMPPRPHILGLRELGIMMNTKRQATFQPMKGTAYGRYDHDDSGTYDPHQHASPRISRSRNIKKIRSGNEMYGTQRSSGTSKLNHIGHRMLLTFSFTSQVGLDLLRQLTPDPHQYLHNSLRASKESSYDNSKMSTDSGIFIEPSELKISCVRCKKKHVMCSYSKDAGKCADRCDTCERLDTLCYTDPLKGQLKARKPKIKTQRREEVSAVSTAIIPRRFLSCNQCRRERIRCSLRKGDDLSPCKRCRTEKEKCEFEPSPSKTMKHDGRAHERSRAATKDLSADKFGPPNILEKRLVKEGYFAASRKRSGFAKSTSGLTRKQVKPVKKSNHINREKSSSPELIGTTRGIAHVKIKTAFSHPIHFFHNPAPNGSESCDWCKSPFYGLEGYGEITIEVIPALDGHGYEEIGDGEYTGWGQRGRPPSRMCEKCTLSRFDIISCAQHKMKTMEDNDPLTRDFRAWNRAIDALAHGDEAGGQLILTAKFCAVCSALAEYRCSNNGEHSAQLEGRSECGLRLCSTCNDLMGKMEIGKADREINEERRINVLDDVIREANSGWAGHYGGDCDRHVRADVSFLTTTGELYTRLLQGMGGYFTVSDEKDRDDIQNTISGSSSDEENSEDEETLRMIELATKRQAFRQDISKSLLPKEKCRISQTATPSSNWSGGSFQKSPFISPKAKTTPREKAKRTEYSNILGRAACSDWMETRPVTSKKSWARTGCSFDHTAAYGTSMNATLKGNGRNQYRGKGIKEAIVISDDDDDADVPILRGY